MVRTSWPVLSCPGGRVETAWPGILAQPGESEQGTGQSAENKRNGARRVGDMCPRPGAPVCLAPRPPPSGLGQSQLRTPLLGSSPGGLPTASGGNSPFSSLCQAPHDWIQLDPLAAPQPFNKWSPRANHQPGAAAYGAAVEKLTPF